MIRLTTAALSISLALAGGADARVRSVTAADAARSLPAEGPVAVRWSTRSHRHVWLLAFAFVLRVEGCGTLFSKRTGTLFTVRCCPAALCVVRTMLGFRCLRSGW